jgi:diphthine-ammonia ligase
LNVIVKRKARWMRMKKLALSWSGGKDGCLALDVLKRQGVEVPCLVTTVPAEIGRTFGHGEKMEMISLQGEALGIPVHFITCTFENYTESFVAAIKELKQKFQLTGIAYGDLYFAAHREWGEKVAAEAVLEAVYPLWMDERESFNALSAFIHSGYKATVIRVREEMLDESWLGRGLDASFLDDIQKMEVCPMGENGEYHTFVYDGPLFMKRIVLGQPEIIELETTKKLEYKQYILSEKKSG